jgi:hypothetical protein
MLHGFNDTIGHGNSPSRTSPPHPHLGIIFFLFLPEATSRPDSSPKTFQDRQKIALLDKVLDLLQPAEVLLLLLHIDVLGNEDGEIGINTPLVEVGLEESLEVLVELREGRAGVHLLRGKGLVGDLGLRQVGGGQVSDGLDLECAAVGDEVDAEGASVLLAGARDEDVDVGGECRLGVVLDIELALSLEYSFPHG